MTNQLSQLKDLLKIHWNYSDFRFGQEQAIKSILEKKHTVVIMPTGGGKSLIYQLPSLLLDGVTIVISPLIALMKDQVDALDKIGVPATFINSSLSAAQTQERLDDIQQGFYKLIYIAPERFYSREFTDMLKTIHVELFAIDEAHCISQWGHDFRPSYMRLRDAIKAIGNPTVLAVTATATPEVKADIIKQLELANPEVIVTGFDRPNLKFGVIRASDAQKYLEILNMVRSVKGSGIIYAGTRQKVESLLDYLTTNGVSAAAYHAGMEAEDRKSVQNYFMQNTARVIIATNAFGLGINKPDIRFVVHFDMPGTIEAYYQEAGRAGRDGKDAYCLLFYSPSDRYLREFFIKGDNPPASVITDIYEILLSYDSDTVLATYAELKEGIREDVPDMAIGTALKILEHERYISRNREKTGQAYLKFLYDTLHIKNTLSKSARVAHQTLDGLHKHFGESLKDGVSFLPDDIAMIANVKREAITRLIKKLLDEHLIEYRPPFRGTEISILKKIKPHELEIDFAALKEKYKRELAKLDLMESYIYESTCRRKYILDYFGDVAAHSCGSCDNCHNRSQVSDYRYQAQQPKHHGDDGISDILNLESEILLETKLTQLETYELYQKGLSIDEMAQTRNLKPGTIIQHLCFLLQHGKDIAVHKFVDEKKQKLITKAAAKYGTDTLTSIKENLGDAVSWDDIRLVLAKK